MSGWLVVNPSGDNHPCASEEAALTCAKALIETFVDDDGCWLYEVKSLRITRDGKTIYQSKEVKCDPPDYELEAKEEDPDYQFEFDEYCEYVMERVTGD